MTIADLLVIFKERMNKFVLFAVNEILIAHDTDYKRYDSTNKNWIAFPAENIKVVGLTGTETHIYPVDYGVAYVDGYITFNVARLSTDVVKADYSKIPFSDADLTSILESALKQIRVLTFHTIDVTNFSENYSEAILKKAYTIALRELQFPTTKYFALSIAGRSIDKSTQTTQINLMIESNEKELLEDINAIRYFDKTNTLT